MPFENSGREIRDQIGELIEQHDPERLEAFEISTKPTAPITWLAEFLEEHYPIAGGWGPVIILETPKRLKRFFEEERNT